MKCQATRTEEATVEFPSQSPDGPYHLCTAAAERLQYLVLRPLEWFNLATIHGPFEHYLHDDFYSEDGEACQPKREVEHAERFPCPVLADCDGNLQKLLDFAMTRWHLKQPVIDAFEPHIEDLISAIKVRFTSTRNRWFHERLVEIAGNVLERRAEQWFRELLQLPDAHARLHFLRLGYKCISHEEGLSVAKESLSKLPQNELAQWCRVLAHFRDPSVLSWIEANVHEPFIGSWGDLAAMSSLGWDRASKWLEAGRPLSLVALDAMIACGGPRPSQSFLVQKMRPRLRSTVPPSIIEEKLRDYVARDRSPRVSKAVAYITANLPVILSSE